METIDALLNKISYPKLKDPFPSKKQMDLAYRAAFRAPDHGWLRPWRFIEVTNSGREKLGKAFKNAALKNGENDKEKLLKYERLPLRAPMIIVLITEINENSKIPAIEQIQSTAVAAQNISLALFDMGYGVYWRTGSFVTSKNSYLNDELSLKKNNEIIGYLYVGTPSGTAKKIPELDLDKFVSHWN